MYTLLVTGDVPGAAAYFNPLVQQTIIPCTSGTRPTPSHEGMTIYETDTNQYMKWTGSDWVVFSSSRLSYTPTLTSTGTPPTLGTGSVRAGWYSYMPGPSVCYSFFIQFGTSGTAVGSGNYQVTLPVNCSTVFAAGHPAVGATQLADSSTGGFKIGTCFPAAGLSTLGLIVESSQIVGSAAPWAWAASDYVSGSITYPI